MLLSQRRMSRCKCSELMRALKISVSSTCCLPARHHWQPHHASQQQHIWLACSVLAASLQRGVCFSLKLPACQAPLASPPHLAAAPPSRFIAFTTRMSQHLPHAACLSGTTGSPTTPRNSGFSRSCSSSGRSMYPRVDPAIITLVTGGAEWCLLGRKQEWPRGRCVRDTTSSSWSIQL